VESERDGWGGGACGERLKRECAAARRSVKRAAAVPFSAAIFEFVKARSDDERPPEKKCLISFPKRAST
jgi:hypothetical protein